jgi:hypothetical protein
MVCTIQLLQNEKPFFKGVYLKYFMTIWEITYKTWEDFKIRGMVLQTAQPCFKWNYTRKAVVVGGVQSNSEQLLDTKTITGDSLLT